MCSIFVVQLNDNEGDVDVILNQVATRYVHTRVQQKLLIQLVARATWVRGHSSTSKQY